jgi:hypothetical protein
MKEKALSEALLAQSNLVLDVLEGKRGDIVADTCYHFPKESLDLLERIDALKLAPITKEKKSAKKNKK